MAPSRRPQLARPADALAVSAVAWVRVIVVVAVAAAGSFVDDLDEATQTLFLLAGFVWVPWSVVVLFASERPSSRMGAVGGPAGDTLALFIGQLLVPATSEALLSAQLLVLAFAGYTAGRVPAGLLTAGATVGAFAARALADGDERIEAAPLLVFVVAAAAIIVLLDRTAALQGRAAARAARLQSSADAVLARIADGVIVTDAAGIVRSCNPAAARILGATVAGISCTDALGMHVGERRLPCASGCGLLSLRDSAGEVVDEEVWRFDGDRRQPMLANATAITNETGEVVEVIHSVRDITRLKQSEEAKTLFLATASHELKTPLTVIRGFVETLLLVDVDVDQRTTALKAVHRRTVELGSIVDRLLLSSRIEAGRVELQIGEVDLAALLAERAAAMGAATGRRVDVCVDDALGTVAGDAAALATIIDHLVDNAVKYSPNGGPISVRGLAGEPVIVTVTDQGIGMDTEQAAHCFDKFWQGETGDVRRFGGTGIGLYIVKSLVETMGGRVGVESERGTGTTFVIELAPWRAARADEDEARRGVGEATMIREFMRQIGVPERST